MRFTLSTPTDFFRQCLLLFAMGVFNCPALAQAPENRMTKIELENGPLAAVFSKIKEQTGLAIYYPGKVDEYRNISLPKADRKVKQVLDLALKGTDLNYRFEKNTIFIYADASQKTDTRYSFPIAITGRVIEASTQQTIVGANIFVKGTAKGTSSDTEGKFAIKVEESDILVFSFIGFKTVEIPINGRAVIDVAMEVESSTLQEVIVNAGYYDVADREKTGNISRLTAKEIVRQPVANPLQAMQGRVPGIYISQDTGVPGGSFQVQIRGLNSLTSGNKPLYVVDGVPFNPEVTFSSFGLGQSLYGVKEARGEGVQNAMSPLNVINPNDIESIEILKDADATAIYGSRGANGVVLITTKRGKAGAMKVDLNFKRGVSLVTRRLDLLKTEQYIAMRNEAVTNDVANGGLPIQPYEYDINGTWDQSRYTDWQKVLIGGSAKMTDFNGSMSAGNDQTQLVVGVGYNSQGTVFPGDDKMNRFSTHFSVSHTSLDKRFTSRFSTNYSVTNSNVISSDLASTATRLAPNAPALYDESGEINWENSTWNNPLASLQNRFTSDVHTLLMNAELGYQILKQLHFKTGFGINDNRIAQSGTQLSTSARPSLNETPANSLLIMGTADIQSWSIEPQVNWDISIGKGALSVLVGATYQGNTNESIQAKFTGFVSNGLVNDPNSAAKEELYNTYNAYKYAAIYSRVNYAWNEKYIFNVTGRRDASSRFGPGRKVANFGAVGAAWIFSDEKFIKNSLAFLSFGKIRSSYGLTGNDQIGDYQYLDTYRTNTQYQGIGTLMPERLFNSTYGWEVNTKLEAAIELGFLNDRILFNAAWYRNLSSNQLTNYTLPGTTGFSSILRNSPARVLNTGVELDLNTDNLKSGSFKWMSSFNITFPKNKLISFPNLESSPYANYYAIGKSLSMKKAFHYLGVDPTTGRYEVEDVNNDGVFTDEDKTEVLEFVPNYYGGLSNSFNYRDLQLDVFFQFVKQTGQSPSLGGGAFFYDGTGNLPWYKMEGRWHEPGDEATMQYFTRSAEGALAAFYQNNSDAAHMQTYFIRLKNISVSYQLPGKWLNGVKTRVYFQGQNLLTFTNYKGLDPEVRDGVLPPLATFVVGLQLNF